MEVVGIIRSSKYETLNPHSLIVEPKYHFETLKQIWSPNTSLTLNPYTHSPEVITNKPLFPKP